MRVLVDKAGVRHRYEKGARRDTRCGLTIPAIPVVGDPDCMACVSAQHVLTLADLSNGAGIEAWVQLYDVNGDSVGDRVPLTFINGSNVNGAEFTGIPPGTMIRGHSYQCEDGFVVGVSTWKEPIVVREGFSVVVDPGKARVR